MNRRVHQRRFWLNGIAAAGLFLGAVFYSGSAAIGWHGGPMNSPQPTTTMPEHHHGTVNKSVQSINQTGGGQNAQASAQGGANSKVTAVAINNSTTVRPVTRQVVRQQVVVQPTPTQVIVQPTPTVVTPPPTPQQTVVEVTPQVTTQASSVPQTVTPTTATLPATGSLGTLSSVIGTASIITASTIYWQTRRQARRRYGQLR